MPDALPPSAPPPTAPDAAAVVAAGAAAASAFAEARDKGLARGDPIHLLLAAQVAAGEHRDADARHRAACMRWFAAALGASRQPLTPEQWAALAKDMRQVAAREMAREAWTARWRMLLALAALWAASVAAVGWACYGLGAARPVLAEMGVVLDGRTARILAANDVPGAFAAAREWTDPASGLPVVEARFWRDRAPAAPAARGGQR